MSHNIFGQDSFIINYSNGELSRERSKALYIPTGEEDTYTIKEGDDIRILCDRFYDDPSLWWKLAEANGLIEEIFSLPKGMTIIIPNKSDL